MGRQSRLRNKVSKDAGHAPAGGVQSVQEMGSSKYVESSDRCRQRGR